MSKLRLTAAAVVALSSITGSVASAADGPPLPHAVGGGDLTVVGSGVLTPTAFAFGRGAVFVAGYGDPEGKTPGGIYVLRGGKAVPIPGLPGAAGIAWRGGTLYATPAGPPRIVAWSGWNGSSFQRKRVVWSGPRRMSGLNGLAVGPNGRLYVGVGLTDEADHKRSDRPFAQSVISMRSDGKDVRTVARGLRQPWQLAFARGIPRPFVTVLGQENLGRKQPPDYVIVARNGDDYGFPSCNWSQPAKCATFAKPVALLPAHSSPTGLAVGGSTLYVALFGGTGRGPEVISLTTDGRARKRVVTGFAAPVVAVGASGRSLYVGDLTGSIYRVAL